MSPRTYGRLVENGGYATGGIVQPGVYVFELPAFDRCGTYVVRTDLASGGVIPPGGLYRVGEPGPELR